MSLLKDQLSGKNFRHLINLNVVCALEKKGQKQTQKNKRKRTDNLMSVRVNNPADVVFIHVGMEGF